MRAFLLLKNKYMLTLNNKLIRKGKPVGLPYQGSKKKIAKQIVEIIKQNFGTDKVIFDVFGGGGAITAECLINGLDVKYSDADPIIVGMLQRVISTDREYIKSLIISRDEFLSIREKQNKTIDEELKLLINSFGNARRNYLYSKEISDLKYELAKEIIANHNLFGGYKQTETYKLKLLDLKRGEELERLEQLERLQQLEQLQQLQRLEQLEQLQQLQQLEQLQRLEQLEQLEITSRDYSSFTDVKGAVFYCDPPYESTDIKGYSIREFNSHAFYDWAHKMSKDNTIIISSYHISDSRFEPVFLFEKARSTITGGSRGVNCEKLFMVKSKCL